MLTRELLAGETKSSFNFFAIGMVAILDDINKRKLVRNLFVNDIQYGGDDISKPSYSRVIFSCVNYQGKGGGRGGNQENGSNEGGSSRRRGGGKREWGVVFVAKRNQKKKENILTSFS